MCCGKISQKQAAIPAHFAWSDKLSSRLNRRKNSAHMHRPVNMCNSRFVSFIGHVSAPVASVFSTKLSMLIGLPKGPDEFLKIKSKVLLREDNHSMMGPRCRLSSTSSGPEMAGNRQVAIIIKRAAVIFFGIA